MQGLRDSAICPLKQSFRWRTFSSIIKKRTHAITSMQRSPSPRTRALRQFLRFQAGNELTYAELSLTRPNSLETFKNGGSQYGTLRARDEPTIYAQIDHNKRAPPVPAKSSVTSPLVSPVSSIFSSAKPGLHHREVVTVRTPLMGCQQESCV